MLLTAACLCLRVAPLIAEPAPDDGVAIEIRNLTGAMAREMLERALVRSRHRLARCRPARPPAQTVLATMTIEATGYVSAVEPSGGSAPVRRCTGKVLKGLTFPASDGAGLVIAELAVTLPPSPDK